MYKLRVIMVCVLYLQIKDWRNIYVLVKYFSSFQWISFAVSSTSSDGKYGETDQSFDNVENNPNECPNKEFDQSNRPPRMSDSQPGE